MQLGEYAMGAECESFSQEVVEAVHDAYGDKPQIDNMWAGEAAVWCSFDVLTGKDTAVDDQSRAELRSTIQALLEETFDSGVEVTLVYGDDQDFILLDTRESLVRAECKTVSEQVEGLVVERYGDDAYLFQVRAPATSPGDAECSFDVLTQQDVTPDDPVRVELRQAVQAILPVDAEANLVYADGRDRVTDSGATTEQAPISD